MPPTSGPSSSIELKEFVQRIGIKVILLLSKLCILPRPSNLTCKHKIVTNPLCDNTESVGLLELTCSQSEPRSV